MTIRARLLLLILFATLIPALVGGLQFADRRSTEIAAAKRDLAADAEHIAEALRDAVRATAQLQYGLSRVRELATSDRAACSRFLAKVLEDHPQYTGLVTILPDGKLFCDSLRTGRTLNVTDRRYFQEALRGDSPVAIEPVFGRLTGRAVLQIAYADRTEQALPAFVLLASLDLEKFIQGQAKALRRHTALMVALADSKGTVLSWHPGGEALRGRSVADSPLFRFAREQRGAQAREFPEADGPSRIWAARDVPEFGQGGMHVLVGVPTKELLAPADRVFIQALSILALVSALALVGAWLLVEFALRRPAARIERAVARFNQSDFGERIGGPYPSGEIGALMAALDQSFDLTQNAHRRVVHSAEVLGRANRALGMLLQTNMAVMQAADELTLLPQLCRVVTDFGGYGRCWLGYAEPDGARRIRPMAQSGGHDDDLAAVDLTWADRPGGRGPIGEAVRTGEPALLRTLAGDPDAWRECAARDGEAALMALPISSNDETVGVLVIYTAQADRFDPHEVQLLRTLAADMGFGIHALRNRAELARHRLQLEELVEQRTAELLAAQRDVESFFYSVSHDLRAPLRHVQAYAQLLGADAGSTLSPEARRYLQVIAGAGAEMDGAIDELLLFLDMNREALHEADVDLEALVRQTIARLKPDLGDRNIAWEVAPLPRVIGDAAMLSQVFAHLLANAVKYTRPRDPARIEIGCAGEEHGRITVFVRDNGVGFDMEYAAKLFGVFQRLHRADEFEGKGIGLAHVRRIIARHGGRTWAQSRIGEGATFYLTLKRSAPVATEEQGASHESA